MPACWLASAKILSTSRCSSSTLPGESSSLRHPASSGAPLSLRELVMLMESASDGGSTIFPILGMNMRDSTPVELADFITVTSDFYAHRYLSLVRAVASFVRKTQTRFQQRGQTANGSNRERI